VASIAQAKRESEDDMARHVSELEMKLATEDFELAAKAKALSDLRAEAEFLSRSKDASAQQVVEMQSKLRRRRSW
jgi:hypothetical protein